MMAQRPEDRIETPHLTLVRATLCLIEAEQAYFEALGRSTELPLVDRARSKLPQDLPMFRSNFQALLGADGLAEATWPIAGFEPWPLPPRNFDSLELLVLYLSSNPEWRWGMWYILFNRPLREHG